MPRVHFVKKARKDNSVCKKGQSYYWWQFRFRPKQYSLTYPKPQQLTQSDFLQRVYDIQDSLSDIGEDATLDDAMSARDNAISEIQDLSSEQEDKLGNIPDSLQSSPVGEMIQGRIDSLSDWESDLEGVDLELDRQDYDSQEEFEDAVKDAIQELGNTSYNGE